MHEKSVVFDTARHMHSESFHFFCYSSKIAVCSYLKKKAVSMQ